MMLRYQAYFVSNRPTDRPTQYQETHSTLNDKKKKEKRRDGPTEGKKQKSTTTKLRVRQGQVLPPPPPLHAGVKFQVKFCLPQDSEHERSHVTHKVFVKEI